MDFPEDLRYSSDHEWARPDQGRLRVGISDFAQDSLGDIVYIDLPAVGSEVGANEKISEVESTKSVSDIFAPVAGVVVEVNEELADHPERMNEDPYGEGWICVIEPADAGAVDALLDAAAYQKLVDG